MNKPQVAIISLSIIMGFFYCAICAINAIKGIERNSLLIEHHLSLIEKNLEAEND